MLGIEAHRFATGRFYATAIKLSSLGVVSATSRKQQHIVVEVLGRIV